MYNVIKTIYNQQQTKEGRVLAGENTAFFDTVWTLQIGHP